MRPAGLRTQRYQGGYSCQRPTTSRLLKRRGPRPPRRLGLSGKLLLLTIPLVMIAGLMIYVPAIANFRINRLNDRLAAANTAALVLDAAPLGMVPDSLARQILTSIGARAVAIKMGQQRRLLASADLPPAIDHDIDMRTMTAWSAIVDSFETMLETGNQTHPRRRARARRRAIHRGRDRRGAAAAGDVPVFPQSAAGLAGDRDAHRGAGLSGAALSVRAADAAADRQSGRLPRKSRKRGADHRAEPARRRDRRGGARIVRHAARSRLDAASRRAGSPRLALRSRRSTTICAICWRPRNCCRTSSPACPIRGCSASRRN